MAIKFFNAKIDARSWFSRRLAAQAWFDPIVVTVAAPAPSTFQAAWAIGSNVVVRGPL